ncbi:hypothetical protein J2S49_000497 [Arcanobacterium wilhelmae]|uniref:Uncharacterized protein n=1 Tax=Arcanobacterium wilhelmae TaxID=1803177 RepID=A0ABT9NB33_9ACTO|nr:hypothetical protein [Arcanobacterium wilhelmae]
MEFSDLIGVAIIAAVAFLFYAGSMTRQGIAKLTQLRQAPPRKARSHCPYPHQNLFSASNAEARGKTARPSSRPSPSSSSDS